MNLLPLLCLWLWVGGGGVVSGVLEGDADFGQGAESGT